MGTPSGVRRFVVAGTGRSGTKYIQSVLRKCGLTVSHEQVFKLGGFGGWGRRDGDVSGLAPPVLSQHPSLLVLHQVRHPLPTIRSIVGRRTSARSHAHEKAFLVPAGFPDEDFTGRRLRRACLIWLHRNELVDAAGPALRWRVEALGVPTLRQVLDLIGWIVDDSVLEEALATTPTDLNRSRRSHRELYWDDIPADLRDRTRSLAETYGYPA